MKRFKLGQAAMEYLIIVGFAMALILPLTYLIYNYSQESYGEVAEAQITNLGRQMISNIETMYYLGEPSRITIDTTMPVGVINMTIFKNLGGSCTKCIELRFTVQKGSAQQEIGFGTIVNITAASNIKVAGGTFTTPSGMDIEYEEFDRRIYSEGLKHITISAKGESVEIGIR